MARSDFGDGRGAGSARIRASTSRRAGRAAHREPGRDARGVGRERPRRRPCSSACGGGMVVICRLMIVMYNGLRVAGTQREEAREARSPMARTAESGGRPRACRAYRPRPDTRTAISPKSVRYPSAQASERAATALGVGVETAPARRPEHGEGASPSRRPSGSFSVSRCRCANPEGGQLPTALTSPRFERGGAGASAESGISERAEVRLKGRGDG